MSSVQRQGAAHQLSRRDARRIAVTAQLLTAERPDDLMATVRRLTLVQNDLTAHVAPNAELVVWSRLGRAGSPDELEAVVDQQRLIDLDGMLRPREDVALYRADMADWPGRGELTEWQEELAEWVEANRGCRLDVLDRLRADGPLPARALPDTCDVPWRSSGWTNDKNVVRMLDFMRARGEVAVTRRENRERWWDLAERVYPDDPVVPAEQAERERDRRRLAALGIARRRATLVGEPNHVGDAGEPAVVEGVRGTWQVDPAYLDDGRLGAGFRGRTAVLSPLDRLVFDRKRVAELFEFDYQLEMYKPAAKRRWGYFALPVLHGDRLVGKVDATSDRRRGVLRVDAVHEDVPFSATLTREVHRELRSLADWLELDLDLPG
ncbi:winged helix-turn-helix domain-containing protein [Angustibacter peucedani]